MADTQIYYDSTLTGAELDEALKKLPQVDAAVEQCARNVQLAQSWAEGGTGIREGEDLNSARYWCGQAQTIAQGAMGWYADDTQLADAFPTGQDGQWAIVGTTDTIWTWDSDTGSWIDTGNRTDLSDYYTKSQAAAAFSPKSHASASTAYGAATASLYGHTKLSDTASTANGAASGVAATPKCVAQSLQPKAITPSWLNGFTNSGTTKIWRIGQLIVCQLGIKIPTVDSGKWLTMLRIPGINPGINVNGRMETASGGEARDWLITVSGDNTEVRAYLTEHDSGNTYNLPVCFVSTT